VSIDVSLRTGRVGARLARQVEVGLAQVDLSLSQYRTLMLLDEGAAAASALADYMAVSRPSVTAVVDGLVNRGLVERQHDDGDRRRVEHRLTEPGRRVLCAADAAVENRLREIAAHLPDEEQAADAFAGLALWRAGLDAYRAARKAKKGRT
jgi:long-chain acyl-CoA synthetase